MTTEFELSITGSSKNLMDAISLLGEHSINLNTIATARVGDRWVIKFLTGSEEECRRTFMKADLHFKDRKVLVVEMNNRPGEWVRTTRKLVDAGVELDASYLLSQKGDKQTFVFGVSDYEKAKKAAKKIEGVIAD